MPNGDQHYPPATLMDLAEWATKEIKRLTKENTDLRNQIEVLNAQLRDLSTTIKTIRKQNL